MRFKTSAGGSLTKGLYVYFYDCPKCRIYTQAYMNYESPSYNQDDEQFRIRCQYCDFEEFVTVKELHESKG